MIVPFFVLLLIFFATTNTYAAEPSIVLNEIYPPTNSDDWIELYNTSSSEIDISGWKLLDTATTPMKILPVSTKIAPKSFLVVSVSNRLNNTGDTIKLVDQNETEIDLFNYTSCQENKSFARLPDGGGSWSGSQSPTKGTANADKPPQEETKPTTTGNITLTEFMPDPDGGNEWVEVYNPLGFEIDIGGWKIDDIEGASSPYTIPANTKIGPVSFLVFSFSPKLNNSGDSIRLLDPNSAVVESYSYKEAVKGTSFAKDTKGAWQITTTLTPGGPNKITAPAAGQANSVKSSTAKSTAKSQTNTAAADTSSFDSEKGNYTLNSNQTGAGKVAGATSQNPENNKLSILLIAAGASFIFSAAAWPFVEKRLWIKKD